jgi:membrane protease YdiL (CAAX protease family)
MNPIVIFLLLSCAWSWSCWAPAALGWLSPAGMRIAHLAGSLGPALGALASRWLEGPRPISTWLAGCKPRRSDGPWVLGVLALPVALALAGQGVGHAMGQPTPRPWQQHSAEFPDLSLPAYALMSVLFYGFGEELGWRGFLLPRLQARMSPLRATGVLAVVWPLWHWPLFAFLPTYSAMSPLLVAGWVFNMVTACALFTFLFNATGGSVLVAALFHGLTDVAFLAAGSAMVTQAVGALLTLAGIALLVWPARGGQRLAAGEVPCAGREA